jgi:hypothetical protein
MEQNRRYTAREGDVAQMDLLRKTGQGKAQYAQEHCPLKCQLAGESCRCWATWTAQRGLTTRGGGGVLGQRNVNGTTAVRTT